MASKKPPTSPPIRSALELLVSREEAKIRLQDRIKSGADLKSPQVASADTFTSLKKEYDKWNSFNSLLLKQLFSSNSLAAEYDAYRGSMIISLDSPSLAEKIHDTYEEIDQKIHRLDSIIGRLELVPLAQTSQASKGLTDLPSKSEARTKKVFVVHGRDEIAKTTLELFIREMGLEPIVLHRQADEGLTLIEKFEKHSDVGYAFILLTPDEVAYLATEDELADSERKKERRARPNVIFEFGFFVGKLGRAKVCCLYTGEVTLPSDLNGLVYKRYMTNVEEVGISIQRDLKAAGYTLN
jgi:predicted nucleotide-binding protein